MRCLARSLVVVGYALLLARAAQAQQTLVPVTVVGAAADGIKLTRTAPDFSHRIQITSTAVTDLEVTISVPPFQGPETTTADIKATIAGTAAGQPLTLKKGATAILDLQATLPLVGTYVTSIAIAAPDRTPLVVALQVTRTRGATTVQVKDLDTVPVTAGHDAVARFTVYETSGQTITIYPPELSGLAKVVADKRLQAAFDGVPVVTAVGATPAPGSNTYALAGGGVQAFTVTVKGLDEPGQYTGNLHVASPNAAVVDQSVTFLVRGSARRAGGLILLGVIVSLLLHWYYRTRRPNLVRGQNALLVRSQIGRAEARADLTSDERAILAAFRGRIDAVLEAIRFGETAASDATIAEVRDKLALFTKWVDGRRRVDGISPARLAATFRAALDAAEAVLRRDGASSTDIANAMKPLDSLATDIANAVRQDLDQALKQFKEALQASLGKVHLPAVTAALEEARRRLAQAQTALEGNRLSDAAGALTEARGLYSRALLDDLRSALAAGQPRGFSADEWTTARAEVERLIATAASDPDPQSTLRQYEAARGTYLSRLLEGLVRAIDTEKKRAAKALELTQVKPDEYTGLAQRLTDATARAASAREHVAKQELDAATTDYVSAEALVADVAARVAAVGGERLGARAPEAAGPFAPASLPEVAGDARGAEAPWLLGNVDLTRAKRIHFLRLGWDTGVTAVIALLAVMIGLKMLWATDLTWGGIDDSLAAVLWGLGLHQVSFEGIDSLAQRLKGTT